VSAQPPQRASRTTPSARARELARSLLLLGIPSAVACLLALEVFFRVGIPAAEVPLRHFDRAEGILRFDSAGPREGLFTRGRFAEVRGRWRINEAGWNSAIEYLPRAQRAPGRTLVAVIGDSYVNGFQVDVERNLAARLREVVGASLEVYGFGMPGAPLSQYLQMSRYVARRFDPDVLAIAVVHNDFHESLRELHPDPAFLQLERADGGLVEVPPAGPREAAPPPWMRSALARYLLITLQSTLLAGAAPGPDAPFVANVPVEALEAHRERVREATFWVVERLRRENPARTLVVLMDAPRADLYAGTLAASRVLWLNRLLAEACAAYGVPFVDLSERFAAAYARDGTRFESAADAHWNEAGHREAALALGGKLVELGVVTGAPAEAVRSALAGGP
jgi:Fe2+ transport system protein FeoA